MEGNVFYYETPIGKIGIVERQGNITHLFFGEDAGNTCTLRETEIIRKAGKQLEEYFAGSRKMFDLPIAPEGTPFMRRVWQALCEIPYGETRSYRDIAVKAGNEKACRAVGQANNRNPIAIIIPCHRVIGANGQLVGYGGGLPIKTYLLDLEKRLNNPAVL